MSDTADVRPQKALIGTKHPLSGSENGANPKIPENPDKFATVLIKVMTAMNTGRP
ncbi:MAG: hypothetical protein GDA39_08380 [Hyphomonadaceae bacterium]|nr:hypothetical protein [Hyphomonadaceae bacterium]